MEQLSQKQAIAFYDSGEWKNWNDEQIVRFQLFQDRLCVEWSRFHEAVGKVLDRPVFTHEFASSNRNNIVEEYLGVREAPSLEDVMNLIPKEKRLVIGV